MAMTPIHLARRAILPAAALAAVVTVSATPPAAQSTVPLCPGLTIVTAVNQSNGDYESIKTIESMSDKEVRLKYSVERLVDDLLSSGPPKLEKYTVIRTIQAADLREATLYLQQFSPDLPEMVPGTTAVGTSAGVLNALKTKGESKLGVFINFTQGKNTIDRNVHPNVYDNQSVSTVSRVGTAPVMIPVILNDEPVNLPAIQATGDFFGEKHEFFFLDDPRNPLALKFRLGIGHGKPLTPDELARCDAAAKKTLPSFAWGVDCAHPNGADHDVLTVTKITCPCAAPPPGAPAGGGGGGGRGLPGGGQPPTGTGAGSRLEQALATTGKVDVYSIYFSFNSDVIREESEPTLKELEDIMRRHPDWKLAVNGHTDGIGTDQYNLDLSKRRAAAVKNALATKHGIDAGRFTTAGFGKSQPKDTNDTLEGRARNRRVELVRM